MVRTLPHLACILALSISGSSAAQPQAASPRRTFAKVTSFIEKKTIPIVILAFEQAFDVGLLLYIARGGLKRQEEGGNNQGGGGRFHAGEAKDVGFMFQFLCFREVRILIEDGIVPGLVERS